MYRQDAEPGGHECRRSAHRKEHEQPRPCHDGGMQRVPALAVHPVEPLSAMMWLMQAPQPWNLMAEAVHGVQAKVQHGGDND